MTKMRLAAVSWMLAVAVAAFPQSKAGSLYTANRLVQECKITIADYDSKRPDISTDGQHCLGYVQGFVETATMWQVVNGKSAQAQVPMFCLNPKATNEVIIRKIPIWALEHPEDSKGSAIEFLLSMLTGDYPCAR